MWNGEENERRNRSQPIPIPSGKRMGPPKANPGRYQKFNSMTKPRFTDPNGHFSQDDWVPNLPLPKPFPGFWSVGPGEELQYSHEDDPTHILRTMTKPWPRQFWSDPTSPKEIEKKEIREKYASARKVFRLAYADMLSNLSQEALSNFSNGHLKFLEVIHSYMVRAELRDSRHVDMEYRRGVADTQNATEEKEHSVDSPDGSITSPEKYRVILKTDEDKSNSYGMKEFMDALPKSPRGKAAVLAQPYIFKRMPSLEERFAKDKEALDRIEEQMAQMEQIAKTEARKCYQCNGKPGCSKSIPISEIMGLGKLGKPSAKKINSRHN